MLEYTVSSTTVERAVGELEIIRVPEETLDG